MNTVQQIRKLAFALIFMFSPTLVLAEQPKVLTSIKPVQALVFSVMGEGAAPELLLPPGTSPHAFTLKPSQAKQLQNADVVFWIGPNLETGLEAPLQTLGAKAKVVTLLLTPDLDLIYNDGALDPHVWLSPNNTIKMINLIRDVLVEMDSDNAKAYTKNAKTARNRMKLLKRKATQLFAPTKDLPYVVQHDGFAYLARDFGLNPVGFLEAIPGHKPGAKHLSNLRKTIKGQGVRCLFVEPQFTSAQAKTLAKEMNLIVTEIDLMGTDLTASPTLSVRILQNIIMFMDKCQYVKPKTKAKK
ncbi:MAG: hypothetical protein COB46_11770 [Rhodospirillaceae bacterium]|nr:MAG: hypothetical protein COB46_11770 [Rhodospirillaceae bacterium]